MSDTLVLRNATADDAAAVARVIAASFEQYRGKLIPESGAFRETAGGIAAELTRGAGAIVAERNGEMVGCVLVEEKEGDLYFGRLSVLPSARGQGLARLGAVHLDAVLRAVNAHLGLRVKFQHGVGDGALAVAAGHALDVKLVLHGGGSGVSE